ncbi:MAG TPA: FtsQ-type POTRA domain-containing protein [Gemmatimonadales bacterium]|nr:FtsQ-type POTRA domain-containing protein [Gemmatimonadales bacterium]
MGRFLRPGWLALYAALALVGTWQLAPRVLRRLEFFRVRRVEVVGLHYLGVDDVIRALGLPRQASVFDPMEGVARRARAIPGVQTAEVSRRPPGTLRVTITEVPPVALVPGRDGMVAMDEGGRPLPFDPSVTAPDLPLTARPDSLVGRLLGRVRAADPELFAQVGTAARAGTDVVLEVRGRRLWFRPDAPLEAIRAVTAVAHDLARRGKGWQELDGRWAGQVIVRGGDA